MRRRLFSLCIGACVVAMAACGIPAGGTSDPVAGGGVSSAPPVQSEPGSDGGSEEKRRQPLLRSMWGQMGNMRNSPWNIQESAWRQVRFR